MRALSLNGRELSMSLVKDAEIRALNAQWRKKDKATDVLSFPLGDGGPLLGDIVISTETARRAANEHATTFRHELSLYLAHGLLHLLGHDHHTVRQRKVMAAEEARLLGSAGMLTRR